MTFINSDLILKTALNLVLKNREENPAENNR